MNPMRKTTAAIIFTIGFFGRNLNAQIITDRPDQTESSSTVPKGSLQIESGILLEYVGEKQQRKRNILLPTNLFRYGILNGMELRILNQFELIKWEGNSSEGISDLEIGTKIQIMKQESKKTEIAFLTHMIIPTGTEALTSRKFGSSSKLSISHQVNENVGIGYNLGYNYFGDGSGDFTYTLAVGIGINSKVGIYIEPYGEIANMDKFIANFDAGLTYLANDQLQFDFSFGTGINNTMNYMSIGCSWLFKKK